MSDFTTVSFASNLHNDNNLGTCFFLLDFSFDQLIGRVLANGPGDWGSFSGRVIPTTQKVVLDTSLLNTQHYEVHFKDKVEQSKERSSALPLNLGEAAIEKGAFESPSTTVADFTYVIKFSLIFMCIEHED